MTSGTPAVKFWALWIVLFVAKAILAWRLPLFGDEAFYWQEGQHLAWAYSDLPGLTAWLARLGVEVGGTNVPGLRWPFLLLGAAVPLVVVRIARREWGEAAGWQAGLLAMLMPLSGWLGTLALPDAPLVLACLLALDAILALQRRVAAGALVELGVALVAGALVHYRFAPAVLAGLVGMLLSARGRALLVRPVLWLPILAGAAAWLPLLLWNRAHGDSGLQFQLVERHPWRFHADGWHWLGEQALALTPGLFVLALAVAAWLWRRWRRERDDSAGVLLGVAAVSVLGYFVLAFFADEERVSFHWPLAGWLALLCAAPPVWAAWRPLARRVTLAVGALGLFCTLGVLATYASPAMRSTLADSRWYPDNFAGWTEVGAAVRDELAVRPGDARLVADNFMLGAQLGVVTGDADIPVLDHPLNHKHGRAVQLQLWSLERARLPFVPVLLVVEDTARPLKARLAGYHELCGRAGALPPPRVLNVDHGRKRFLMFALPAMRDGERARTPCIAPALAWIDAPAPGVVVRGPFVAEGWAFKDGAGLRAVEVTLDGAPVARADYGHAMPNVTAYWSISTDPNQPRVGWRATLDATTWAPGEHWLGLRLHGADGSREDWPEQRIVVER
jgi:4-amino-4-deoxy-L-arabinose transferase-like glycosyltransferase